MQVLASLPAFSTLTIHLDVGEHAAQTDPAGQREPPQGVLGAGVPCPLPVGASDRPRSQLYAATESLVVCLPPQGLSYSRDFTSTSWKQQLSKSLPHCNRQQCCNLPLERQEPRAPPGLVAGPREGGDGAEAGVTHFSRLEFQMSF